MKPSKQKPVPSAIPQLGEEAAHDDSLRIHLRLGGKGSRVKVERRMS